MNNYKRYTHTTRQKTCWGIIWHNKTYLYKYNADTKRLEIKIHKITSWTTDCLSRRLHHSKHLNGGRVAVSCWDGIPLSNMKIATYTFKCMAGYVICSNVPHIQMCPIFKCAPCSNVPPSSLLDARFIENMHPTKSRKETINLYCT